MKNFKRFLLNVPYNRKTEVLKGLTYHTYNREHRVHTLMYLDSFKDIQRYVEATEK